MCVYLFFFSVCLVRCLAVGCGEVMQFDDLCRCGRWDAFTVAVCWVV